MEIIKTPKIENVRMLDRYSKTPSQGTLYLAATHLIFKDPDEKKETWILLMHIASMEKLPLTTTGSPLLIRTKTFLSVTFVIPKERDCHDVFIALNQLSQPTSIGDLYCFTYTLNACDSSKTKGWDCFNLLAEYQRMGVPNENWSLTELNREYQLCDTYPRHLFVPNTANNSVLIGSSKFRAKGRLPVLSYLHHNKASICRCSQPLSGFSARCLKDEKMLHHVVKTNPNAPIMYVVDTRPKINAMANRAAGKGYENEAFYENIKFQFLGIENIHVMRSSLYKVVETCEQKNPTMNSFLSGIESSGWLRHIKSILDTSWFIAQAVDDGVTVLVHCSDGWDRTAQVCSLASLLLDPFYRTLQGYQTLIEKDWLAFGHKFSDRCGHIQTDSKEISPIFTQLLDATWQLMQHFPCTFEFNEQFLVNLHDHIHSCQFGTFVGNCEKERLDLRLNERTYSFWGYVEGNREDYINPLYSVSESPGLLVPNLSPQNIRFWRGMYCRFENGVHPREPQEDLVLAAYDHTNLLEDHFRFLSKKLTSLKNIISKKKNHSRGTFYDDSNSVDNKYIYKKSSLRSTESTQDHPLKIDLKGKEAIPVPSDVEGIQKEFEDVALDWKLGRGATECSCSSPFDNLSKKNYCRKCGGIFCIRCITKQIIPGHMAQTPVPVCKPCCEVLES
ncbi:hypothetical protein HHI36_010768 [Cryptolaemus montrouzieri]|uniref:phosphatidylinositol-3,5-bisphosphate 3-phosphatase n=1 Tax=Cryptolaemus montrouzieri TaxID=559131 RepID=A0ABD2MJM8_9CUCU